MKDIIYFFHLSRPTNVFITLLAFALAAFIALGKSIVFLQDPVFWYGCVCLVMITATGYWVNDTFDFKIDQINKPRKVIVNAHLSRKKVLTAYFSTIGLAMLFSFFFLDLALTAINGAAIVLLFGYAAWLKRTTVVGNLVIASLTALVVYYAAVMYTPRLGLVWTIVFAFEITFIREVVKDIQDIEGDLQFHLQTLPIRIGIKGTKRILIVSYILFLLSCYGPLILGMESQQSFNWIYLLLSVVLVQIPAILLLWDLRKAAVEADFARHSQWLKYLIFLGMITILFLE